MTVLFSGGAGSGKSELAERWLCAHAGTGPRIYLATMQPYGAEAAARIARHRTLRAGRGFVTVERCVNLAAWEPPAGSDILLEDVGNLCANELYDPAGSGEGAADAVVRGVEALQGRCRTLVLVSNEAGSGGTRYLGDTLRYLRVLGEVNRRLAALADRVAEVSCGIVENYK